MVDKDKLIREQDTLRRKVTRIIFDKPSATDEVNKIMHRLNYLKGALFALEVNSAP